MRPIGWILLFAILLFVGIGYFLFVKISDRAHITSSESRTTNNASPKVIFEQNYMSLTLTSPAFEMNGVIPALYTCDGENISPELIFSNIPKDAKSLALTMEDPDVPTSVRADGMWNHWIVWNMPPSIIRIGEGGVPPGIVGKNTSGKTSYGGPCPPDFPLVSQKTLGNRSALDSSWPPDREHRYFFTLYALDTEITLASGATKEELLSAIVGHTIEQTHLIGRYNRN